jgi:hypothetical protein
VDPRAGLDDMENSPAPPGRPARSQSLYRLSYPGSLPKLRVTKNIISVPVDIQPRQMSRFCVICMDSNLSQSLCIHFLFK